MHPGDSTDSRPGRRTQLAEILAGMPDVIGRLIFEHVPDEHDRCRGCTSPGTGRPKDPWPCSLRKLADEAGRLRVARHVHDANKSNC
jgi:hypothetical protein